MHSLKSLAARLGCLFPQEFCFDEAIIDSRNATSTSLFFALPGENTDGHKYVTEVLGAGGGAVVSRDGFTGAILEVDSVEEALLETGAWVRDQMSFPVIGITGSSGKTTTRKMLAAALATKYKTWQTKGNLNNHLGLPMTLIDTPEFTEMLVLEMGMNHAGELNRLGWAARPDVSLITNIGTAHIENFGSREGITHAKAEIFNNTSKGGVVIIPAGEPILKAAAESLNLRIITHGSGGDCYLDSDTVKPWGIKLDLKYDGIHNMQNAVAVIAAAELFGIDPVESVKAISELTPSAGRGSVHFSHKYTIIDESYNANPESMTACLVSTVLSRKRPIAAVLGDMLELGTESLTSHKKIIELLKELKFDIVVLVGDLFKEAALNSDFESMLAPNWEEALHIVNEQVILGSTILIKGSNSMNLGSIVQNLKKEGI